MNRQFCRIFLILSLAILVVCLPAQAAHASQAGSSSPMSDHGAQVNVSSGLSAGTPSESVGKAPVIDTGSSVSSQSLVQAGPDGIISSKTQDRQGTTDKSTQASPVNTQAGSSPSSGQSGDSSGQSDIRSNGRAEAAGGKGSPQRTEGGNAAGIPDAQGQSKESGRLAGMIVSPGGAVVARSVYGGENSYTPVPGANRGPAPQRQQHGPPAQSSSYPCGPAQASPLPPSSGQTRDESKEETTSRQKSKRIGILSRILDPIVSDPAPSSFPLQSLFPLNMLLIGGFRRISKKNVLEHDARQVIYQAITATPGIDVKTLSDMTGINENTLRYHVDRLVATGKISCFFRPGVVRYFQNKGAYSQFEHMMFHYLWSDTPREILLLLYQHPGLTRQHLADALAISGPSVTRQMDNLIEDRVVENRFPGRSNHYYLTAEATLTIDKAMSQAPVMMHSGVEVRPLSVTAG
ncbi:MAG: winged helix-turn-helix transcriptional regulator [Methanoregula sp.]|nr:winged helix-turn-helix transcriptional regulator [Methanoregula sp.]